jgi:hypothetical protein
VRAIPIGIRTATAAVFDIHIDRNAATARSAA